MGVPLLSVVKDGMPTVTVAPQGVDIAPLGEGHDKAQGFQALGAFFQKVPVND